MGAIGAHGAVPAAKAAEPAEKAAKQIAPNVPQVTSKRHLAAFIRGGALFMKEQGVERRLTEVGGYARNPAWSYDGDWIAFNRDEEQRQIWLANAKSGKSHMAAPDGGNRFQWSPNHLRLAYLQEEKLYMIGAEAGDEPAEIAGEIGNFGWLPDGSGFVVSSAAQLLPDGWTPVRISRILLPSETLDPIQAEQLYVLPKQINDLIVVDTSGFKWSATGRWLAFLAKPTASLSSDGNTLCVLSADGKTFLPFDQMADNEQWIQWSPKHFPKGSPNPMQDQADKLAYIGGLGREATSDKRLKVTPVPEIKPVAYTPPGYVDQSLAWYGPDEVIVARAKEGGWTTDPNRRPKPVLTGVKLNDGQKTLANAPRGKGDFAPVALNGGALGWIRSDRTSSDAMLADSAAQAGKARPWIKGIDIGDNFYEQWNWAPVLRFYARE